MSSETLPIRRPIPRRPFELGIPSPASTSTLLNTESPPLSPSTTLSDDDRVHLDPQAFNFPAASISRVDSYTFLTSSTLSGIYSPNIASFPGEEADDTCAPPERGTTDEGVYKLMQERRASTVHRRPSLVAPTRSLHAPSRTSVRPLVIRTGVLFLLGIGYGALLSRLGTEQKWTSFPVDGMIKTGFGGGYLACWGLYGVFLGSLLPWFDLKWEQAFENIDNTAEGVAITDDSEPGTTDWALVVRGIGAFAGIVFAIRKVPWASTMQVSMTLAAVNPFLWYLIDRSKPGFLLSSAVGLAGSVVLMGLNPEIVPTPTGYSSRYYNRNPAGQTGSETMMLGGLVTQKTIETGIWVLSVLFCSCVCFGNIGRRLAHNKSAAGRGRWGGLR